MLNVVGERFCCLLANMRTWPRLARHSVVVSRTTVGFCWRRTNVREKDVQDWRTNQFDCALFHIRDHLTLAIEVPPDLPGYQRCHRLSPFGLLHELRQCFH